MSYSDEQEEKTLERAEKHFPDHCVERKNFTNSMAKWFGKREAPHGVGKVTTRKILLDNGWELEEPATKEEILGYILAHGGEVRNMGMYRDCFGDVERGLETISNMGELLDMENLEEFSEIDERFADMALVRVVSHHTGGVPETTIRWRLEKG